MKRLTITIPDELHRKISEIRGKRIADEALNSLKEQKMGIIRTGAGK